MSALVPFDDILVSRQVRSTGTDWDHVASLAAAADQLPAILVDAKTMRIVDGRHRREAWKQVGRETIPVVWYEGDDPEGAAFEANLTHGLPLPLRDRKDYAARLLQRDPDLSDRDIARRSGVSDKTVAQLRPRLGAENPRSIISAPAARERAAKVALTNPELSVRQTAEKAGTSYHTAQDTKARLARGEDPVPPRLHVVPPRVNEQPRLDEIVHFLPNWRGTDFKAGNDTRAFGLWMHRRTGNRHDFAEFCEDVDLTACPEAHRQDAANELRRVARFYERAASEITQAPRLRRAT